MVGAALGSFGRGCCHHHEPPCAKRSYPPLLFTPVELQMPSDFFCLGRLGRAALAKLVTCSLCCVCWVTGFPVGPTP